MSDPESIESSGRQTADKKTSPPASLSLFNRGRRTYYVGLNKLTRTWHDWWHVISGCTVMALVALSFIYLAPALQVLIGVIGPSRLAAVQTLLVTIGGSFVGATAIVSAMLMYALQVNVERMPHKLFRRFSTDHKILFAFLGTFALAALVALLSMVVTPENVVKSLLAAFWFSFLIVVLFGFAYRRSLDLVNPNFQLSFLVKGIKKDLARWGKRAERIARSAPASIKPDETALFSSLDVVRLQFFQHFPNWTQQANEALFYATSFASRYAQKGDYAVVNSAYSAVVAIHVYYLQAKGRTFVSANGLLDSPLVNDAFLTHTLELLRQIHREAITQGNERFVDANLQVMANLAELYLHIDYASPHETNKSHANLAAHYLAESIKEVIPHNRPDVLMKGIRLLGRQALLCAANGGKDNIAQLSEKISAIALVGIVHQNQMPVTVSAMSELAKLTIGLLQSTNRQDLSFPLHEVRRDIHEVAMLVVERTKDERLGNRHSHALGGAYSEAFPMMLIELTNQLLNAEEADQAAQQMIQNIEAWSEQLHQTQKKLLLATVAARSGFVFDMIHWITSVTQVLAMLAKANACPPHSRDELQKTATSLVNTMSFLPDDKETVAYLANYQIHERLFECGMTLYANDCVEVAETVAELLVHWAFRTGGHVNGWGTLKSSLYCVAVLSLRPELQAVTSVTQLAACMAKYPVPEELLDRAARNIRTEAQSGFYDHHYFGVKHEMSREDPQKLSATLEAIANLLSPGTATEPIRSKHRI